MSKSADIFKVAIKILLEHFCFGYWQIIWHFFGFFSDMCLICDSEDMLQMLSSIIWGQIRKTSYNNFAIILWHFVHVRQCANSQNILRQFYDKSLKITF